MSLSPCHTMFWNILCACIIMSLHLSIYMNTSLSRFDGKLWKETDIQTHFVKVHISTLANYWGNTLALGGSQWDLKYGSIQFDIIRLVSLIRTISWKPHIGKYFIVIQEFSSFKTQWHISINLLLISRIVSIFYPFQHMNMESLL